MRRGVDVSFEELKRLLAELAEREASWRTHSPGWTANS